MKKRIRLLMILMALGLWLTGINARAQTARINSIRSNSARPN